MQHLHRSLQDIQALYDRDLYVQAYQAFLALKPLRAAATTEERILAARIAMQVGDNYLSDALRVMAYRKDPQNPAAVCSFARKLMNRSGLLHTFEFLREKDAVLRSGSTNVQVQTLIMRGRIHSAYRDFRGAYALMEEARLLDPADPWVGVLRSEILEDQDRLEEAYEAARPFVSNPETGRFAAQHVADLLMSLNRDDEAIDMLREKADQVESFALWLQLSVYFAERKRLEEALDALLKAEVTAPIADVRTARMLAARKFDIYYDLNDFDRVAEVAPRLQSYYYKRIAERLKTGNPHERVRRVLPVGFVRQHHDTCAPATLAAVSTFLGKPADHVAIADEICYGGTPDFLERRWAVKQGFVVHEFRVTWEATVALIDLGLPFTLTTIFMTSGHLQAVIGYDDRAGTLVIRDPNTRHESQALAEEFLEQEKSSGPRGMVLVPPHLAAAVEALNLPDVALYEQFSGIRQALEEHDRSKAAGHLARMLEMAGDNRLTLQARRTMAGYDANASEDLAALDGMLEQFPEDRRLQMSRYYTLGRLDRPREQLAYLKELCAKRSVPVLMLQEYADQLASDAREGARAMRFIRRALFCNSMEAGNLRTYARLLWRELRLEEALPMYYFGATMAGTDEDAARAYFIAARRMKKTEEALLFLRLRWDKSKEKSGEPAQTLYNALENLMRQGEALTVLDEAIRLRPQDGSLLCFAADVYARRGNQARADELLAQAEPRSHRLSWLRTAAQIAQFRCDFAGAIERWREALVLYPLHETAHDSIADMLAESHGLAEAVAHLSTATRQYPENVALHRLLASRLMGDELTPEMVKAGDEVNRRLLELQPGLAWNYRQYALFLAHTTRDLPRAVEMAEQGIKREPNNPFSHQVMASVLRGGQRWEEARAELRKAIRLSVDMESSISSLIGIGDTGEDRLQDLAFVQQELMTQPVYGAGITAYRDAAYPLTVPEDLLKVLQVLSRRHADLWEAHAALISQLRDMQRLDEALTSAKAAVERFPLVSHIWARLGSVHRARQESQEALAAFAEAMVLAPAWGFISRQMAQIHALQGNWQEACKVLETAVARAPLDTHSHDELARIYRRLGEMEKAWDHAQRALRADPDNSDALSLLVSLGHKDSTPERALEYVRSMTKDRPGSATCLLNLAELLSAPEDEAEFFRAVNRAIEINPNIAQAYDIKAVRLTELKLWDEALAVCRGTVWRGDIPAPLRGRACWVLAQKGELQQAVDEMRPVLAQFPDYFRGWKWYAEWGVDLEQPDIYMEAGKRLVHLDPRYAVAHGYLAAAYMAKEDKERAMEEYAAAFALDPEYLYAADRLLTLQLEAGKLEAALAAVNQTIIHADADFARSCVVRLAVAAWANPTRGGIDTETLEGPFERLPGRAAAMHAFRLLCGIKGNPEGFIDGFIAMQSACEAWKKEARSIIKKALSDPETHGEVGHRWARRWKGANAPLREVYALLSAGRTTAKRIGIASYLELLAEMRGKFMALMMIRFIHWRFGPWLAEDPYSWGNMAYALSSHRRFKACITWTQGWEQRQGCQGWMLENRAEALRGVGRGREAYELNLHCLENLRRDSSWALHHAWIAAEHAVEGRLEAARTSIAETENSKIATASFTFARLAVLAILELADAPEAERATVHGTVRSRLRANWEVCRGLPTATADLHLVTPLYTRALARLSLLAGDKRSALSRYLRDKILLQDIMTAATVCLFALFLVLRIYNASNKPAKQRPPAAAEIAPSANMENLKVSRHISLAAPPSAFP